MDRYRLTPTFNGVPPHKPNFLPNAPSQISLPTKPLRQDHHIFPFLRPQSEEPIHNNPLARPPDDTEISIFDAQRYFNENQESTPNSATQNTNLSPKPRDSSSFRSRSFRTTPTASSEASWNSQIGLLRNSQTSHSISVSSFAEQRKEPSSSARRIFGHSCPCSCRKSVDVEENYSEPKSSNPSSCVTSNSCGDKARLKAEQVLRKTGEVESAKMKIFPGILPQNPQIFHRCFSLENPFPGPVQRKENSAEDSARVSLEVFKPADKDPFFKDRRNFTFHGSPMTRPAAEDDVASDTSSDLFEIESFSTFRRRDSLDEISSSFFEQRKLAESAEESIAPSECYPPSEVSVEWSVTTAEGFDRASVANFSSAVSEYEQLRHAAVALGGGRKKGIAGGGGGGGGLLSCRSEKSICVVGPKAEWFEPERRLGNSVRAVGVEDRIVGVAKLVGKPVRDGAGVIGLRSRARFI